MKRYNLVKSMEQMPTVFPNGKVMVSAGLGDRAGEFAGVEEHGMPVKGRMEELGKPMGVSDE